MIFPKQTKLRKDIKTTKEVDLERLKAKALNENTNKGIKFWLNVWQDCVDIENYPAQVQDFGMQRLVQFWQHFQTSLLLSIPNCTRHRMITYTYIVKLPPYSCDNSCANKKVVFRKFASGFRSEHLRKQNLHNKSGQFRVPPRLLLSSKTISDCCPERERVCS